MFVDVVRKIKTACRVLREEGISGVWAIVSVRLLSLMRAVGHVACGWLFRVHLLRVPEKKRLRVLYVINEFERYGGQTVRYRVFNLIEALKDHADASFAQIEEAISRDDWRVASADIIVCMRTFETVGLRRLRYLAARYHVPIVFDIDDLIFLPQYFDFFSKTLDESENAYQFREMFEEFHQAFLHCDFATASTPYIVEKMRPYKSSAVIHNGLNATQISIAETTRPHTENRDKIRICYLSGSRSHSVDFTRAQPAIMRILKENPSVHLCVAGYLNEELSKQFPNQVSRAPYMPWQELLAYCAECDINIAPLDTQNPFCHAKSELKYFEAALVGVPTVASPTDTFLRCIRPGENGLLAETEEEWYTAIKSLLKDGELRARICRTAREDVLARYVPAVIAEEALAVYQNIVWQWREAH